jgi:hypothetical protein
MTELTQEALAVPYIARLIADTGVQLRSVHTQPSMGSNITWRREPDSTGWDIALLPSLYYDGPTAAAIAMAIVVIHHQTDPIYRDTPCEEFDRLTKAYLDARSIPAAAVETTKRELVAVGSGLATAFALDYLLTGAYLNAAQVRRLAEYMWDYTATAGSLVAILGDCAALRRAGARSEQINHALLSNRWYELLAVIDQIEAFLVSGVALHKDVVTLYEAVQQIHDTSGDLASRVDFLRSLSLGAARRRADYDLHEHLTTVYRDKSRYCLLLVSAHYESGPWQRHELASALSRALDGSRDYVLPLRLDDTQLHRLLPTIGSLDLRTTTIEQVVDLVVDKLES